MTFAWPWAFVGLLALPTLAAIYWLRQRAQRRAVSSLMLWRDELSSRASGRRPERFESSRLFVLELIILTLLVLAAAGPQIAAPHARRPLVVVLDDSLSMAAHGAESPREAAVAALQRELKGTSHSTVTLLVAGDRPQVIGAGAVTAEEAERELASWRPRAAVARIDEAISLASELGGPRGKILVLSDQSPPAAEGSKPELGERVVWWAFGRAAANLAVVNALRSSHGAQEGGDHCLVEIANYSPRLMVVRPMLVIQEGHGQEGNGQEENAEEEMPADRLELSAGELTRWHFSVPDAATATIRLVIEGATADGSSLDDQVVLLPQPDRRVRVSLAVDDSEMRQQVAAAVDATELAMIVDRRPELRITDASDASNASGSGLDEAWQLRVVADDSAVPFLGPFILDRRHPLTSGLDLEGVIWGAASSVHGSQTPAIIAAGESPLLTGDDSSRCCPDLTLFWHPGLSNLQQTTNWPILWWNLLSWRSRSVPGLQVSNLRLGSTAVIGLRGETAELVLPDGERRSLTLGSEPLEVAADQLGVYQVTHGGVVDRWSVNALTAEESDLRLTTSGRWGDWGAAAEDWERRGIGWIFLFLALGGLTVHLAWTGQQGCPS